MSAAPHCSSHLSAAVLDPYQPLRHYKYQWNRMRLHCWILYRQHSAKHEEYELMSRKSVWFCEILVVMRQGGQKHSANITHQAPQTVVPPPCVIPWGDASSLQRTMQTQRQQLFFTLTAFRSPRAPASLRTSKPVKITGKWKKYSTLSAKCKTYFHRKRTRTNKTRIRRYGH